jgi:hypothetical protein
MLAFRPVVLTEVSASAELGKKNVRSVLANVASTYSLNLELESPFSLAIARKYLKFSAWKASRGLILRARVPSRRRGPRVLFRAPKARCSTWSEAPEAMPDVVVISPTLTYTG